MCVCVCVCVCEYGLKTVSGKAALNVVNENRCFDLQLSDFQLAVTWFRQSVVTFYHGDPVSNSSPRVAKH
jgi:hypothetical protein